MTQAAAPAAPKSHEKGSVKETLISITIAFVIAFVFRAFVIEAFVIPTGSMAPTLLGAHMRFQSPQSGENWTVNPWFNVPGTQSQPLPVQGTASRPVVVTDPMTGASLSQRGVPRRSGDRILVLKYLRGFFDPQRFDCVVFKCPQEPQVNYIKRLIGLPGEQVALVDGDVFVRTPTPSDPAPGGAAGDAWGLPGWTIARKDERVQRATWQPVFASQYWPLGAASPAFLGNRAFQPPWDGPGWDLRGPTYSYSGQGEGTLTWSNERWGISDRYSYNEMPPREVDGDASVLRPQPPYTAFPLGGMTLFPVSDVRLACGVEPRGADLTAAAVVRCRGHEFRARLSGMQAVLEYAPIAEGGKAGTWTALCPPATLRPTLSPGRVANVEFWHVDQSLWLWVDGELAARAEYAWTPEDRVLHSTGRSLDDLLRSQPQGNPLANPTLYLDRRAVPRWEFSGPVRLHRVEVSRDIHYQPGEYQPRLPDGRTRSPLAGQPMLATHPSSTPTLGPDQHICCGDNSPFSADSRAWATVDPWVEHSIGEESPGLVPRKLMIGKAFFVYFPSLLKGKTIPMVDFGRMRWIW